jgi:hypothetical protein
MFRIKAIEKFSRTFIVLTTGLMCSKAVSQLTYHVVAQHGDVDPRTGGILYDGSFRNFNNPTISLNGETVAFYGSLQLPDEQVVHAVFRREISQASTASLANASGPVPAWPTNPAPYHGGYSSNAPIALDGGIVVFSADMTPREDFRSGVWVASGTNVSLLSAANAGVGLYGQYYAGTTWTVGFRSSGIILRHIVEDPLPYLALADQLGYFSSGGVLQRAGAYDCMSLMTPYGYFAAWYGGRRFGDSIAFVDDKTAFSATPCDTFDHNLYMAIDGQNPGAVWPIAMIGMPAPEVSGATVTSLVSFTTLHDRGDPGAVEAAFEGSANGAWCIWAGYVTQPGAPTQFQYRKVLQANTPVGPNYPGLVHSAPDEFSYVPGFTNGGNRNHFVISSGYNSQVAAIGKVSGDGVTYANNSVLWIEVFDPQTGVRRLSAVARKGDSAPGWPGAHYGNPTVADHFVPQMRVLVNRSRFLVFQAFAASSTESGNGIWVRKPNGEVLSVARPGTIVPLSDGNGGSEEWSVLEADFFCGINVSTAPDTIFDHGCNGMDGTGSSLSDTARFAFWAVLTRNQIQREVVLVVDLAQGTCVADVDDGSGTGTLDGGVTIDDLLYYLDLFAAGDVRADVDDGTFTGTPDGGVTIDDLLYFLLRFESGC